MKRLKSHVFTALMAICVIAVSCEQENRTIPEFDRVDLLTTKMLNSSEFESLSINKSSLDLGSSQFVNSNENSIYVPYKTGGLLEGIIAVFNVDDQIRTVANYKIQTQTRPEEVFDALKKGTFNGEFSFTNESVEVAITMQNSKVISQKGSHRSDYVRIQECDDITEPGGAADCAGARLEDMNWWDAGFCYTQFIPCMAQLTISCWLDDCVVHPGGDD